MPRIPALALLGLLLAASACAPVKQAVDPRTAQLEELKALQAEQQPQAYRTIVAQRAEVAERCAVADATCGQMHLIVGHACYALAENGWGADSSNEYDCAIEELRFGLAGVGTRTGPIGTETRRDYARALMAALRGRIQLTSRFEQARPLTAELARVAADHRRADPDDWAGWFYGALADVQTGNAALNRGQTGEGCAAFAQARAKLDEGAPRYAGPPGSDPFPQWTEQVGRTLSAECRGV